MERKAQTSSSGHPVDRRTAWDCKTSNFKSLSLISEKVEGFVRKMTMRRVIMDVSSPRMSLTGTTGLSEMFSNGIGFQFFMMREPAIKNDLDCRLGGGGSLYA